MICWFDINMRSWKYTYRLLNGRNRVKLLTVTERFFKCLPFKCRVFPNDAFFIKFIYIYFLLTTTMFDNNKFIENRIVQALKTIENGIYSNCRAAALDFDVSIHRLQRWMKGTKFLFNRSSNGRVLNDDEEQAIIRYIEAFDKINMNTRPLMVVTAANYLLRHRNRTVGPKWFKRFKERNSPCRKSLHYSFK